MGRKRITVEQLRGEVSKILEDYKDDIEKCIDVASTQYGKIAKRELQDTSPKRTGHYAKGWAYHKQKSKDERGVVVHNASSYQLTHLLEKGHVIRNGTRRVVGSARAFPHIGPEEEKIINEFETEVIQRIEKL